MDEWSYKKEIKRKSPLVSGLLIIAVMIYLLILSVLPFKRHCVRLQTS